MEETTELGGMSYNTSAELLLLGLFAGMVVCLVIGQRLGQRDKVETADATLLRLTAVEAAIFGLMGLMVAFTFSGSIWTIRALGSSVWISPTRPWRIS